MSCGLKVLTNVKEELEERFTEEEIALLRTKEGRKVYQDVLKEIYDGKCQDVTSKGDPDGSLYGDVGYFKDYHMSFEEAEDLDGYGFGATKPEQIREEILSWNRRNSMECIRLLGEFEKLAAEHGFRTVSEMFTAQIGEDGRINETFFRYPASIYELQKALDCVGGTFTYGQYVLVVDDTYGTRPYVAGEVMAHAAEHPEDFLILGVYYD